MKVVSLLKEKISILAKSMIGKFQFIYSYSVYTHLLFFLLLFGSGNGNSIRCNTISVSFQPTQNISIKEMSFFQLQCSLFIINTSPYFLCFVLMPMSVFIARLLVVNNCSQDYTIQISMNYREVFFFHHPYLKFTRYFLTLATNSLHERRDVLNVT